MNRLKHVLLNINKVWNTIGIVWWYNIGCIFTSCRYCCWCCCNWCWWWRIFLLNWLGTAVAGYLFFLLTSQTTTSASKRCFGQMPCSSWPYVYGWICLQCFFCLFNYHINKISEFNVEKCFISLLFIISITSESISCISCSNRNSFPNLCSTLSLTNLLNNLCWLSLIFKLLIWYYISWLYKITYYFLLNLWLSLIHL